MFIFSHGARPTHPNNHRFNREATDQHYTLPLAKSTTPGLTKIILVLHLTIESPNPPILNINNARARRRKHHFAVCMLAFSPRNVKAHRRPPELGVLFTCSSNLLMMAWTHSTGLCAAMLRRMRAPQCLLSITFAIPIYAPESPPTHRIPPKQLRIKCWRRTAEEVKEVEGGGGSGLVFHFKLTPQSRHDTHTGSLNPPLASSSLAVEHAE